MEHILSIHIGKLDMIENKSLRKSLLMKHLDWGNVDFIFFIRKKVGPFGLDGEDHDTA